MTHPARCRLRSARLPAAGGAKGGAKGGAARTIGCTLADEATRVRSASGAERRRAARSLQRAGWVIYSLLGDASAPPCPYGPLGWTPQTYQVWKRRRAAERSNCGLTSGKLRRGTAPTGWHLHLH